MRPVTVPPSMLSRMLVRPRPAEGESRWGFWLRLADENGLRRPRWLLEGDQRCPTGIARVCPDCLGEPTAVWRDDWLGPEAYWCGQHQVWLIDECPSCRQRLRWNRVRFHECWCGFDLREAGTSKVAPSIVSTVSSETARLNDLRVFGAFAMHGPSGKPGKKADRSTLQEARAQLEAGIEVVSKWPQSFFDVLDQHRVPVAADGTAQLLREAFPGITEMCGLVVDEGWRAKLSSAIDAYCATSLSGVAPIIGRNAVLTEGPKTLKEISEQLGRRVETIAQVLDGAAVPIGSVRVSAQGRRRRVVGEADMSRLASVLGEPVAMKNAARLLALPVSRVQALVSAGVLNASGGQLIRSEIAKLTAWPLRHKIAGPGAEVPMLSLRKALRDWIDVEDTAALLRSVLAGELPVEKAERSAVGEWRISVAATRAWAARQRSQPSAIVSLSQAAERLGLKHDVVRGLVRAGLLQAVQASPEHRSSWRISAADLTEFGARYVPLSVLADGAGIRRRDGFDWAQKQGLKVICGPRVDGSRQYFVDRSVMNKQLAPLRHGGKAASGSLTRPTQEAKATSFLRGILLNA